MQVQERERVEQEQRIVEVRERPRRGNYGQLSALCVWPDRTRDQDSAQCVGQGVDAGGRCALAPRANGHIRTRLSARRSALESKRRVRGEPGVSSTIQCAKPAR